MKWASSWTRTYSRQMGGFFASSVFNRIVRVLVLQDPQRVFIFWIKTRFTSPPNWGAHFSKRGGMASRSWLRYQFSRTAPFVDRLDWGRTWRTNSVCVCSTRGFPPVSIIFSGTIFPQTKWLSVFRNSLGTSRTWLRNFTCCFLIQSTLDAEKRRRVSKGMWRGAEIRTCPWGG